MAAPTPTRFAINGSKGRMGQAVARVLEDAKQTVVAKFNRGELPDLTRTDAIIDFSTPDASLALLQACANEGLARPRPLVHIIGSTGFSPEQQDRLTHFADQVVIVQSGNFSLGINLLMGLLKQASARPGRRRLGYRDQRGAPQAQDRRAVGHRPDAGRGGRLWP